MSTKKKKDQGTNMSAKNVGSVATGVQKVETPVVEVETVNPDEVEELDDENTSENSETTPTSLNLSPEADKFLQTLVRFKADGLIEPNQKSKSGEGRYPSSKILELFWNAKEELPAKEVLLEAASWVPGVRNAQKWVLSLDQGRGKAPKPDKAVLKATMRAKYAL